MIGRQNRSHWKNSSSQYGWVAVVLHWLCAFFIVLMFALGLWMVELNYYNSFYTLAPWIHKSAGVLLFLFMLTRLLWRLINPTPKLDSTYATWEKMLAKLAHGLFYVIIFAIIISGYLIATADGRPVEVFGWFSVPALTSFSDQEDNAGWFHLIVSYGLMGLVVIHVCGFIKHRLFDR